MRSGAADRLPRRQEGGPGAAGEGDQAGPGQRADQRPAGARERAQQGRQGRGQTGERTGHEQGDREGVGEAEGEHDGALAVPVREPPHQRAAGHLADGERTAGQSGRGERAAGPGDEQDAAEPDGGRGQPFQERHHRQQRPGQAGDLPVRLRRAAPPRASRRSKPATPAYPRGGADDTKDGGAGT
ncbi:hypothetical protein TU94_26055 [Streptomyces cyaneogriseus subsp. noncyanogenus]|uniref:Uncharacterized protein n=1 Tax=Streptomyces cyaneogriseus subsp. noncyanogenus TaxID=477245 RepID=A0A0C5G7U5_9ACTN|nr:hypothetical protein TU94_26055 [Streptomyces cyaneogriseus subsp. noncyanogenus]